MSEATAFAGPPAAPRAALVHDWLTGMRGGEKVLQCFAELLPQAPIYSLFHFPGSLDPALEERDIRTSYLQHPAGWIPNYRYLLPLFPRAIESFDLSGFDLVVSISTCVAKSAIRGPNGFHICYCNTPMRYVWDQQKAYFPDDRGPVAAIRNRLLERLRRWDVATAPRVDQYVANSTFVADRIRRYYDRGAIVVHPPVDVEHFTPANRGTDRAPGADPYALVVSALAPYKKIDVAIKGCARAGIPLKIVGTGPEHDRLLALAGDRVDFLGWQGPDELRDLYRRATCLLQPGIEDFGIAPVEALACGCPVVALGVGGVLDIVEPERHGILYDGEGDPAALAVAIDKCRELRFNFLDLRDRAHKFSAQRFRDEMSDLFFEANHRPEENS
ncbi:MAG: glycosyltransferase family 4 protein [bacterium]|nr:glycosyltransferase family 4 protein [bacterium]